MFFKTARFDPAQEMGTSPGGLENVGNVSLSRCEKSTLTITQTKHHSFHSSRTQRTENSFRWVFAYRPTLPSSDLSSRPQAFEALFGEALHQQPRLFTVLKLRLLRRYPPRSPEKPLLFVPFHLGASEEEDFIFSPATDSSPR